ncbi:MAG: DUF503 domain-containing protein [Clostridiales bacterium]
MVVGVLKIDLYINKVFSLKDKRHIIKSIIERIRAKYKISIAEIDQNDKWNNSVIGVSLVSNGKDVVERMIDLIINFIEKDGRTDIINIEREIIYF